MESALVSASVKPDRPPKRFPKSGEMVRVEGRKGLFLVKEIDWVHSTADLMQRVGNREVLESGIPCKLIRTIPRQAKKAIHQFLSSDSQKNEAEAGIEPSPPISRGTH